MTPDGRKTFANAFYGLAFLIAITAALHLAQEVLLPLIFAGLLSFLLSPLVRRFEHWKLPRAAAVLLTAALTFALLGGLIYLVSSQFMDLAGSLPKYRNNLIARISKIKTSENNPLRLAVQTVSDVTTELNKQSDAALDPKKPANAETARPVKVEVVESGTNPIRVLGGVIWPVISPLANALVVIVIVIFMLSAGTDLRDRLVYLVGRARLHLTTQALDEASQRISRYLRAQLMVNASFGCAVGTGLYFIGIPNAVFWGLLGMVMRFLPYVGAWMAAAMPIGLSFAIFPTWWQPALTVTLFVGVELIVANFIEPWLYGTSTEISPLAVVVSALFWTWLWGGVGLVLSTPLTVCLSVAGKYIPDLAFLDLLIGEKPSIAPGDRLYQRLLALNEDATLQMISQHAKEHGDPAAFDEAVLPALHSLETDFRAGIVSDSVRVEAAGILRQAITEMEEPNAEGAVAVKESAVSSTPVLCIPASHEEDEIAALMLARLLARAGVACSVLSSKLLAGESVDQAEALAASIVCISSVPPASTSAARGLCQRLRARLPSAHICVGLWRLPDEEFAARRQRLRHAGADETYPDLRRAAAGLAAVASCTLPPGTQPAVEPAVAA